MKLLESKHLIALLGVLALIASGCASGGSKPTAQQFETPDAVEAEPDKNLFSKALEAQNKGQFESAIQLWQSFLSKYPDSFEGHNNLGLVYYTQDKVTQALNEFETAYRLNQEDPKIRKNLARALRFRASMFHENREYFKTLEILARLELIVEPEERQEIIFKQEQVEDQIFLQVIKADNAQAYLDFVNRFPDGLNAVRAREYLGQSNLKKASKPKEQSNVKSWISSGKAEDSWASSEQPPDYSTPAPAAVYTPPTAGRGGTRTGDFFGADTEGVKKAEEKEANAVQIENPETTIPFEDFEKPERSSGDLASEKASTEGKESRRAESELNPIEEESDTMTAGLSTLPDLKPVPESELPAEIETQETEATAAGDIKMQPAEQEAVSESAASEEPVAPVEMEAAMPETPEEETVQETAQPETAQMESAEPESAETESERIARIVKEEIAKAENEQPEAASPDPAPEPVESAEETLDVAGIDPQNETAEPTPEPSESSETEEPAAEPAMEKPEIDPDTVSETVAALIPPPPPSSETPAEVMKTPENSMDSEDTMVVVQMNEGSTLNVRNQPSAQGEIMGYLENGDMMPFMSESGDWYQIEIEEGVSGWISKRYSTLRKTSQVASAPEASEPTPETASVEPSDTPVEPSATPEEELSGELTPLGSEPQQPKDSMVIVTVSEGATLNVRSLPSSNGAIVDMLFRGDKLPLIKEENGWYLVRFEDDTTGWISKQFSIIEGSTLKASLPAPEEAEQASKSETKKSDEMVTTVVVVKVPEGSSLNVRSSPSPQGLVVGSLKSGEMRPLLDEMDEWYQVELPDGKSGWISRKFSGKMDVDSSFLQGP